MIELINKLVQEKVWCQWNIDNAKSFIKQCIPEFPDELIVNIIFGNGYLISTNNGNAEYISEKNLDSLNYIELAQIKLKSIENECEEWKSSLNHIINNYKHTVCFSYYDYILDSSYKEELQEIEKSFNNTLESIDQLIQEIENVKSVFNELDLYAKLDTDFNFSYYINLLKKVKSCILKGENDSNTIIDVYIQNELKLNSIDKIHPTQKYHDAGYIAPNGDYYGLNGEVANFLHVKLADLFVENNIINKVNDPEHFLEKEGWIKQHDNKLYCYYMYDDYDHYITKKQRETIYNILKQNYSTIFLNTVTGEFAISIETFKDMDTYDFEKYFI